MGLLSVPRFHYPPLLPFISSNAITVASGATTAIDAAGEKIAYVFRVPKTGTIDRIRFATKTVSSSQSLTISLQTVNTTTGDPSGSAYGGSSSETVASPATDTIYTVTFSTPASATVGDMVAIVIEFTSTTGNVQIARTSAGATPCATAYMTLYTGSWARVATLAGCFSVIYDDNTAEPMGVLPAMTTSTSFTITSSSTPDEMGLRFQMPFGARAVGALGWIQLLADARDVAIKLYNDAGTELASVTPDSGMVGWNGYVFQVVRFASSVTLQRGSWYRLVYVGTQTTGGVIHDMRFTDSIELGMLAGTSAYQCYRTDGGAFTDSTSRFTPIHLLMDAIDIPGIYTVNE